MSFSAFLKKNNYEPLAWGLLISLLVAYTYPLLDNNHAVGWDMPGHYYLFERALSLLKMWKLQAYDSLWFGGYPIFTLYPPFTYLLLSAFYFVFGWLLPKKLVFNLFIFLLPVFFVIALRFATKAFFGRQYVSLAILTSLLFFFQGVEHSHSGVGLGGLFFIGLPSNFLGLGLLLFFLGCLYKLNEEPSGKNCAVAVILLALISYTHSLTTVFAYFLLGIYCLQNLVYGKIRLAKITAVIGGLAFLLVLPWWYNFFAYLPYSSGTAIGLRHDFEGYSDPFFMLYPNLNVNYIKNLFVGANTYDPFIINLFSLKTIIISLHRFIVYFPYSSLVLLLGTLSGSYFLFLHKKTLLVWMFIVSLLLLPRDLLNHIFPVSIHYYRFAQYIFVLNLLISTYGLYHLALVYRQKAKPFLVRLTCNLFLLVFIFLSILHISFFSLGWNRQISYGRFAGFNPNFKLSLSGYPANDYTKDIIAFLKTQNITGRIAVETSRSAVFLDGSPHLLSSLIPLELGLPVVPGLIAESALSTGFINPVLSRYSNHLNWGRDNLTDDIGFNTETIEELIARLRLYSVEYIIATSAAYADSLMPSSEVSLIKKFANYSLFKVQGDVSFAKESNFQPYLFVDLGGTAFRDFAEHWFKYSDLLKQPVIYTDKDIQDISARELSAIAGLIISYPGNQKISKEEYLKWKEIKNNIVFLNGLEPEGFIKESGSYFIKDFHFNHSKLKDIFGATYSEDALWEPLTQSLQVKEKEHFIESFEIKSDRFVYLNYNYDLCWKGLNPEQTIYHATPSLIAFFGNGKNTIKCN